MKKLIFIVLSFIAFNCCKNNEKRNTIPELIDIQIWDSTTVMAIKETLKLDTLKYISDNKPLITVDDVVISSFDEHIKQILNFRLKEIEVLKNQKVISNEENIIIYENQGYTHSGYMRSFTVVFGANLDKVYSFNYNKDTDSFSVTKDFYAMHWLLVPTFHSEIEYGVLSGIDVVTKITRGDKNHLSYEVIGIIAK